MRNREITYYSLLDRENLSHIKEVADRTDPERFINLRFDLKWRPHLWVTPNNESFLDWIGHQTECTKIDFILREQIVSYVKKCGYGYEKNKSDFYQTFQAYKRWLDQTIFICKNEYHKTNNEVYAEVVAWCEDWQKEWLENHNPYSPNELEEKFKGLRIPLWQQFAGDVSTGREMVQIHELKTILQEHDFYKLDKVSHLDPDNRQELLKFICNNKLPYIIAMFDFLGFLSQLSKTHYPKKVDLYKKISKWLNSDKAGRAVKGNINSLSDNTAENKKRYTAHQYKQKVEKDYNSLF